MKLSIDQPGDHRITNLAPTVEGLGADRVGTYGYALCLVSAASMEAQGIAKPGCAGGVRVWWEDEGNVEDVDTREILFKSF